MRVNPIINTGVSRVHTLKQRRADAPQTETLTTPANAQSFKGLKGAGYGAGGGILWGLAALVFGGPFLAPLAAPVLIGSASVGALTGTVIEDKGQHNDKE